MRAQVGALIEREYGWVTDPEQITICYGGAEALHVTFRSVADAEHPLSFLVPSFPYWDIADDCGVPWVATPIAPAVGTAVLADAVTNRFSNGSIVLTQPHNPFGFAWSSSDLAHFEQWAATTGGGLVLDLVGASTCADRSWATTMDPESWWIVDSLSKRFAVPGLRLGWIRRPRGKRLRHPHRHGLSVGLSYSVVTLGEHLLVRARTLTSIVSREIELRRSTARRLLSDLLKVPEHGLFVTFDCPEPMSAQRLKEALARESVMVASPQFLVPRIASDSLKDRYLRISIGNEPEERLAQGLDLVRNAIASADRIT
jgi:histidinol-phosphate/aromatic aminotransferase/cobyric acid decarboxylase-like protein